MEIIENSLPPRTIQTRLLGAAPLKLAAQLWTVKAGLSGPGTEIRIQSKGWILSLPPSLNQAVHRPTCSLPSLPVPPIPTPFYLPPLSWSSCASLTRPTLPSGLWAQEAEYRKPAHICALAHFVSKMVQTHHTVHLQPDWAGTGDLCWPKEGVCLVLLRSTIKSWKIVSKVRVNTICTLDCY